MLSSALVALVTDNAGFAVAFAGSVIASIVNRPFLVTAAFFGIREIVVSRNGLVALVPSDQV